MTEEEQLLNEIESHKWQANYKLFALLDCAHLAGEEIQAFQTLDSGICVGLFKGTQDEGLKDVEPLLIDPLDLAMPHGRPWLIQNEKIKPLLIWLISDLPLEKLARHLRTLLSADLPGAPNALLRFYDPRVFHKLMQVLDEDQKSLFYTHVKQWSVWNFSRRERINYAASMRKVKSVDKIALSSVQMHAFNQMDFDDFVRDTKQNMVRDKGAHLHTKDLSDADMERHIDEHIKKSIEFGFESEEAIVKYIKYVASHFGWAYEIDNSSLLSALRDEGLTEDEKLVCMKMLVHSA